jgi:outer membrane biosynthesis protein TonB
MKKQITRRWEMLTRRWDRALRWSIGLSVLFHILLVLLFRQTLVVPDVPISAAGEQAGDPRAAAGGGMEVIAYVETTPPPVPEEQVPIPIPVPDAPRPPVEQREPARAPSGPLGQAPSAGEGRGTDTGPGTDTGTGRGDGGTGEEGTSRVVAPTPRGLILPPSDRPASVRGRSVTVYVFVTERGTVVPDSTRLAPGSGDARFDNRLRRQASEWVFNPARRDGRPVPEWFQYMIVL